MEKKRDAKELTEIKNKLRNQQLFCKTFYDPLDMSPIPIKKQRVYLLSQINELFDLLQSQFESKNVEIQLYKRKYKEIEKLYFKLKFDKQSSHPQNLNT